MLGASDKLEIFGTIVRSISIEMVNVFGRQKRSAKNFLHHNTVLTSALATVPNTPVPFLIDPALGVFDSISTASRGVNDSRIAVAVKSRIVHPAHSTSYKRFRASIYGASFHFQPPHVIVQEQLQKVKGYL